MLIVSIIAASSCLQKPYAYFQKTDSTIPVSLVRVQQPPIESMEILKPYALTAENKAFTLPEIVEPVAGINTPSKKIHAKPGVLKQFRSIIVANKTLKQLSKRQPKTVKTIKDYKTIGAISTVLGIVAIVCVLLSISTIMALGTGIIVAGIFGLLAFIAGVSSVGKLKGAQKTPSIIGIIGGSIGLIFSLFLIAFVIAYTW